METKVIYMSCPPTIYMSGWGRGQRTLVNSCKQFVSVVLAHSHSCTWGYTSLCGLNQPLQRNMGQPWPLVSSKIHQDVSSVCSEALIKQSEFPRRWAPTPSSTYVLLCINTSYSSAVRAKARCVLTADLHPSWLPLAMSSFNLSFFFPTTLYEMNCFTRIHGERATRL